ncbi:MAG: glycosyltransferase family 2 protein [Chlorobiaceae bacterium]|jgi:GT2 family glycosyltransferase|nr:glycosyltransferase family 2 protein [Chlorobiaceae bacterium]
MSPEREHWPDVDVIIPHFRRHDMLERCLDSLAETLYPSMNIIVVDNGGKQAGLVFLVKRYRNARLVKLTENRGYAGGCNEGLKSSSADYVVFMNDDTTHDPLWLERLVDAALDDGLTAALQPKILSMKTYRRGKKVFDYAGGAGGMSDKLGYPYCLGRVFSAVEEDIGQYDAEQEIFWASGVAMFAKRSVVEELGGFDEDFFMHMEEIDLAWRMKLRGYHVRSVPSSVVIHEGGASLSKGSAEKVYFNHRNNLAMLLKNRGMAGLLWIMPVRLCLEIAAALFYLTQYPEAPAKSRAVMRAVIDSLKDFSETMKKRRLVQSTRVVGDREIFRRLPFMCIFRRKPGYIHQV